MFVNSRKFNGQEKKFTNLHKVHKVWKKFVTAKTIMNSKKLTNFKKKSSRV